MDFNPGKYYNILESLVSIFTIDQGQVKVLLLRKKVNLIEDIGFYQVALCRMMKR